MPRYLSRAHFEQRPLSVVMTDVDHFKTFNDRFGHQAGDLVLFEVANVLRDKCRPSYFLARYGGEEFTVVLPGATANDALVVAERLREAVESLRITRESGVILPPITASMGIAEARSEEAPACLLERADQALYLAKQAGRNQCKQAHA